MKDVSVKNAKAAGKDQRLNDGDGLYVLVKTNGAKWWRFDYTIQGKRKTLSLGVYPTIRLADARGKADKARKSVANGIAPAQSERKIRPLYN